MPQAHSLILPRILLVEDHDMTRRMQIRFLSRSYAVDFASTGEEAIELALEHAYGAVIIDIGLAGGLTGVDVMRTLKHTPAHRSTAMVAVTGYSSDADRERLTAVGFDLYLAKPFRWQEFTEVVRMAVRLSAEGRVQPPPRISEPLPYSVQSEPAPTPARDSTGTRTARTETPHMGDGLVREMAAHTTVRLRPAPPSDLSRAARKAEPQPPISPQSFPYLTWQPLYAL